jgi:hypothetical protein
MRVSFTAWYRNNWQPRGIFSVQCVSVCLSVCERLLAWTKRWLKRQMLLKQAMSIPPNTTQGYNEYVTKSVQLQYIHFEIKSRFDLENAYAIRFGILHLPKRELQFYPLFEVSVKLVSQSKGRPVSRVFWQRAENNIYRTASNRRTEKIIHEHLHKSLRNINQLHVTDSFSTS